MSGAARIMSGGGATEDRQKDDFYSTPEEATVGLLLREQFDGVIHECCCGNGRMGRILEKTGNKVVASDINPQGYGVRRDFFTIKKPVAHNIVTNPPFKHARAFIEHALSLNPRKLALLLKSTYWHADTRHDLFERMPPRFIYALTWRLDFLDQGRPAMECAWFVWHRGFQGDPSYRLMRKPSEEEMARYGSGIHSTGA